MPKMKDSAIFQNENQVSVSEANGELNGLERFLKG